MFYAHFVLAKKGPLARIWLAAHWDKKLTKAHVFETDIQKSVEDILHPKVKIALRTSGHLLLGVVRIYSRKAKYLLADCNEAFVKIKMAFRPGMVDLPEENREAAFQAITLPEVFHDFDANVPDLNDAEMQAQFSLNQSRAEEITMREDYCQLPALSHDDADGFGDIGFGDSEPLEMRDASNADHMLDPGSFFGDKTNDRRSFPSVSRSVRVAPDSPIRDDGFGGSIRDDVSGGGLFEGGLFDDAPMGDLPSPRDVSGDVSRAKNRERQPSGEAPVETAAADDSDDDRDAFGGPMSVGAPSDTSSRPNSPLAAAEEPGINEMALSPPPLNKKEKKEEAPEREMLPPPPVDQTALLPNEEEGFALAPVDATVVKGWGRHKRKRKLVIDEVKNISGEEMKSQLSDTSDIVITLDLAPPTRRLMHWKETGGVEKLFALPGRPIPNRSLFKDYQRHLISQPSDADEFSPSSEADKENQLSFDQPRAPSVMEPIRETYRREMTPELTTPQTTTRRGRKRKTAADIEAEAEEHQKRRQEQYMSLLAPSPVPPPPTTPQVPPPYAATPTFPALQTPSLVDQSLPSMIAPEETPTVDILATAVQPLSVASPPPTAPEVVTPTPPAPEPALPLPVVPDMDNMGFDQSMMNLGMESDMYGGLPAQTPGALSERAPPTPWHDDYEMAPSVGPLDEQQTDETYEQFEERVLNKRAAHMYHLVRSKLENVEPLPFSDMTYRNNKKQVAQKFYTLLVLKKHQAVELSQNNSYDEIYVSKGPKFDSPTL